MEDALLAERLGAWALGFIFYPKSPRAVSSRAVHEIVGGLGGAVKKVGVFVDEEISHLETIVQGAGLTSIQLHGNESVDYCIKLKNIFPDKDIFKSVKKNSRIHEYHAVCDRILVDADAGPTGLLGGTGTLSDWEWAKSLNPLKPLILAGGISHLNAAHAIRTVNPYALDLSSGVEVSPGIKSKELLEKLFSITNDMGNDV
jgi:phosphoribosylanthranilate isomerase